MAARFVWNFLVRLLSDEPLRSGPKLSATMLRMLATAKFQLSFNLTDLIAIEYSPFETQRRLPKFYSFNI